MSNLLREGATWLAEEESEGVATDVIYETALGSVTVAATFGSQLLRTTDRRGNTKTERTERDFIIKSSLLVIAGSQVIPERGHRVYVILDGITEKFEVMAPGNEPPWKYADPFKQRFRIHAKSRGIASPRIDSFTPEYGYSGETVVITGENFENG